MRDAGGLADRPAAGAVERCARAGDLDARAGDLDARAGDLDARAGDLEAGAGDLAARDEDVERGGINLERKPQVTRYSYFVITSRATKSCRVTK